jgi:hypothetical protein
VLTSNAHGLLLTPNTTGGWSCEETLDGTACDVLAFSTSERRLLRLDTDAGRSAPEKALHQVRGAYEARRGQPTTTVTFKDWNLKADVSESTFAVAVPAGYEHIDVIQRASAVLPSEGEKVVEPPANPEPPAKAQPPVKK